MYNLSIITQPRCRKPYDPRYWYMHLFKSYPIHSCQFDPTSRFVAAAWRNALYIWDAASGVLLRTFQSPVGDVSAYLYNCAFSPDGQTIAALSTYDKKIRIWNIVSGQCEAKIETKEKVEKIVYSPSGKSILVRVDDWCKPSNNDLTQYSVATGAQELVLRDCAYSNCYGYLASGEIVSSAITILNIWHPLTGECLYTTAPSGRLTREQDTWPKISGWIKELQTTPHVKKILLQQTNKCSVLDFSLGFNRAAYYSNHPEIEWLSRPHLRQAHFSFQTYHQPDFFVHKKFENLSYHQLSADGLHLFAVDTDKKMFYLFNLTNNTVAFQWRQVRCAPLDRVVRVAYSADKTKIAVGYNDGNIEIWDLPPLMATAPPSLIPLPRPMTPPQQALPIGPQQPPCAIGLSGCAQTCSVALQRNCGHIICENCFRQLGNCPACRAESMQRQQLAASQRH